jgi:3-isopropylmalate/(R)-2-methylmalate dehydratase small subunit
VSTHTAIKGRTWCFGDGISTDLLSPGQYAVDSLQVRKMHTLESVDPGFAAEVQIGDVVVAGRDFGCGSSRETAPENLKELGVACVVADSFSRLFLRNAVAIGLPVLPCPGASGAFSPGCHIEVDLATGEVRSLEAGETGTVLHGEPLPESMRRILSAGGMLAILKADRLESLESLTAQEDDVQKSG